MNTKEILRTLWALRYVVLSCGRFSEIHRGEAEALLDEIEEALEKEGNEAAEAAGGEK